MFHDANSLIADDLEWAERAQFWAQSTKAAKPNRRLRQRNPAPLILTGHGVSMRIENGALVIRDGFTHYPQQQIKYRYFPRDLELPTRILLLDGSGTLSFDVLSWLAEQGVALARVKWTGEIATVASGTGYAADREKVDWQRATRDDPAQRLQFAIDLIRRKIASTLPTLEVHIPSSKARETALEKAYAGIERLNTQPIGDIPTIFAIEGECAAAYFRAWHRLPVNWKGLERRPVPKEWRAYDGRSSRANGLKSKNRNASHPVNAMLNYAYAVKLAQVQIEAIAQGYDPTIGIMHNSHKGSPAWALDMIELERAAVDAAILQFVRDQVFAPADFVIRKDGAVRLSPQLARMIAAIAGNNHQVGATRH